MASDISQSSLNLTADEKRAYGQLFQEADPDGLGVVTGEVAVKFFERTKLNPVALGAIWQMGDTENRGLLTPAGFSIVLRLIGHAQAGLDPTPELAKQPGPLPKFDTIQTSTSGPIAQQNSGGPPPIRVPPLAPEKVGEYSSLFEKAGAQGGLLGGDAARQVFERARLPIEVLGQIWNLTDSDQKGALNVTDFVVAMHLLMSMRSGSMRALPSTLPPGLYEAAARRGPPQALQGIPRQFSGNAPLRTQSPTSRPFGTPIPQQTTGNDWLVTARDKAKFDEIFASIDRSGQGFVTGDQAVSFFSDSRLPEETLAQIWDLSDINSEGQLNADEFAVAMYLIRQERAKKGDNRGALPPALPAKLIPPSMRQRVMPPSQPTAPAFDNAAFASQQPKSAADDLFGLDALAGDTSPRQVPAPKAADPFGAQPTSPTSPTSLTAVPAARALGAGFKPFMPTSSFGQGLASQTTGASVQSNSSQARAIVPASDDLLGDNDPEISSKLTNETSELANMSNQIGQLRTQMQEVQSKKGLTEQSLTNTNNQKIDLETRLSQFRTQYEQEIREVKTLEERLTTSRNDTRKAQQELAMVEGAHQDLLAQHQQLAASLDVDQKENATLRQRMQQLNSEVTELKAQVEKLKSDARQQKGMVAINKKQVATNEADKEKLQAEHEELTNAAAQQANQEVQLSTSQPVVISSPIISPGSTNPFFRAASPQQQSERAMSPAAFSDSKPSPFDSFFGPSHTDTGSTAAAPTAFGTTSVSKDIPVTPEAQSRSATPQFSNDTTPSFPSQTEPPAPPRSRQITSSLLPLGNRLDRTESFDSSVRANAPASRSGFSDEIGEGSAANSVVETPISGAAPAALAAVAGGAGIVGAAALAGRSKDSESAEPTTTNLAEPPTTVTAPAHETTIPGAFPGEEPDLTPSTSGSVASVADQTRGTKSDFESAFTPTSSERNGTPAGRSEFPPIRDIEPEESDSDGDGGFDDDFAPASPRAPVTNTSMAALGAEQSDTTVVSEIPPAAAAQQSPPAYEPAERRGSAGLERDSNQFPQQYHGLLPSREITSSPPEEVVQNTPQTISSPTLTGTAETRSTSLANGALPTPDATPETQHTPVPAIAAAEPVDDFDSDFDDLSEAKEETEPDFSAAGATEEESEFNPTFASPTHSRVPTAEDRISTPTRVANSFFTPASPDTAPSSFANFEPSLTASTRAPTNGAGKSVAPATDNSDWDSIFAGLDNPPAANDPAAAKAAFDVDNNATSSLAPPVSSVAPSSSAAKDGSRPALGRAISQGTEHDDPILKMLTTMGYSRDSALKALEKYDYNLDKAADFLASKS